MFPIAFTYAQSAIWRPKHISVQDLEVGMLFSFKLVILNHFEVDFILFSFDCYRRLDFVRFVVLDEIIKFHLDRIGSDANKHYEHM